MSIRGEGTKAILVFGEAGEVLVPFVVGTTRARVPARLIRHHPNHPHCPVILEALEAPNSWKEVVSKGAELRTRTVRCTGGCWTAYEASEQRRILSGDAHAREDWEADGLRARLELVDAIRRGAVPSALIEDG
jgi:hypothetical protein